MSISKLQKFLCERPIKIEKTVLLPLVQDNGEIIKEKFKVTSMTRTEYSKYEKQCLELNMKTQLADLNTELLANLIIVNHCIEPDFKDVEFLKSAGCRRPQELVSRVLKYSEAEALAKAIMNISGINALEAEIVDEAKN